MPVEIVSFGKYFDQTVQCIQLINSKKTVVEILTYGATLHSFSIVLDSEQVDIIVAPKTLDGYLRQYDKRPYYFGGTIGRYAGRIGKGKFELNGESFELGIEDGVHLHSGEHGFHRQVWKIKSIEKKPSPSVVLSLHSPHMEGNYPGNIEVTASYTLDEENNLEICYMAKSDRDTYLNLTNHAYFNLGQNSITEHYLQINSDAVLETDSDLVPTGKELNIQKTKLDFGHLKSLAVLKKLEGLDTPFCLNQPKFSEPKINYYAPTTGLKMEVFSNQPCAIIFTPRTIKSGNKLKPFHIRNLDFPGICIEMQNYPDAPNKDNFPSSLLKKGEPYLNKTVLRLSDIEKN